MSDMERMQQQRLPTRREIVTSVAAGAGALLAGKLAWAQPARPRGRIDLHHHYFPPAFLDAQRGATEHGDVLHEHDHLHLLHHGVGDPPKLMHGRDADQEDNDQPGTKFGAVAEEDRKGAEEGEETRGRYQDRSHRNTLRCGEADCLLREVREARHQEDQRETQASEKDYRP